MSSSSKEEKPQCSAALWEVDSRVDCKSLLLFLSYSRGPQLPSHTMDTMDKDCLFSSKEN